jgi:hypothetical protein
MSGPADRPAAHAAADDGHRQRHAGDARVRVGPAPTAADLGTGIATMEMILSL